MELLSRRVCRRKISNQGGTRGKLQDLGSCRLGLGCSVALTALSGSAYGETPDISGTYWATEYHAKIQIVGGGDLPLTAAGKAAYEKNIAGLKDGSIIDTARRYCVPDGLPRALATPYPFEIFQAPAEQITIVYELNHQVRVIAMDQPMPSEKELTTLAVLQRPFGRPFRRRYAGDRDRRLQRKDLP